MVQPVHLVVVGHGMVGHRFIEALLERVPDLPAAGLRVTVLGEEARGAYDRVRLGECFGGGRPEALSLAPEAFYERPGLVRRLGARLVSIDRRERRLRLADGTGLNYDQLVLATGSVPFVPPIPGRDRPHCHVYRTIDDLRALQASGAASASAVVLGGGLLGLECAQALHDSGLPTQVVESAPRLMPMQVDEVGGALLRRRIEAQGLQVHISQQTLQITDGAQARHRLVFADGTHLEADLLVFAAGIRPRDELARQCALAIGPNGGVAIDDQCRSSDPAIFAIGECASWNGQVFGLLEPGRDMARVVAAQVSGGTMAFRGADRSTRLRLRGVEVASIGDAQGRTPGSRSISFSDEPRQLYKRLVLSADSRRLLGALLVGDVVESGALLQCVLGGLALPAAPEMLILPAGGAAVR